MRCNANTRVAAVPLVGVALPPSPPPVAVAASTHTRRVGCAPLLHGEREEEPEPFHSNMQGACLSLVYFYAYMILPLRVSASVVCMLFSLSTLCNSGAAKGDNTKATPLGRCTCSLTYLSLSFLFFIFGSPSLLPGPSSLPSNSSNDTNNHHE